jgi:hypothetical protein
MMGYISKKVEKAIRVEGRTASDQLGTKASLTIFRSQQNQFVPSGECDPAEHHLLQHSEFWAHCK